MPSQTFAGGLATPFPGIWLSGHPELVDDMCLVSEAELRREIRESLRQPARP